MAKPTAKSILPPLCAAAIIVGVFVQGLLQPNPADAAGYHAAVAKATMQAPANAGPWSSKDVEIPDGALQLLRPNIARSRLYERADDGATAQFLLIHCKDARDLAGHYPPNCYPQVYGYILTQSQATTWTIDGIQIHGRTYQFKTANQPQAPSIVVQQFFALPDGTTTDQIDDIYRLAGNFSKRHRGAAQIQVVYPADDSHTPEQRDAIFQEIVGSYADALRVILSHDTTDTTGS